MARLLPPIPAEKTCVYCTVTHVLSSRTHDLSPTSFTCGSVSVHSAEREKESERAKAAAGRAFILQVYSWVCLLPTLTVWRPDLGALTVSSHCWTTGRCLKPQDSSYLRLDDAEDGPIVRQRAPNNRIQDSVGQSL